MFFSTKDHDNDQSRLSCAGRFGAWWHNQCKINGLDNLNGENFGEPITNPKSMHWRNFGENGESLKSIKMAIRPF